MVWLEFFSQVAAIATAVIAAIAAVWVSLDARRKRRKLEDYLEKKKAEAEKGNRSVGAGQKKKGQHTILHLMANLGLTESEILHASFRSRKILRRLDADDETGLAREILLEYDPRAGRKSRQ